MIGLRILPVMFICAIQQRERITVRISNLQIPIVLVLVLDFVLKVRSKGRYFWKVKDICAPFFSLGMLVWWGSTVLCLKLTIETVIDCNKENHGRNNKMIFIKSFSTEKFIWPFQIIGWLLIRVGSFCLDDIYPVGFTFPYSNLLSRCTIPLCCDAFPMAGGCKQEWQCLTVFVGNIFTIWRLRQVSCKGYVTFLDQSRGAKL